MSHDYIKKKGQYQSSQKKTNKRPVIQDNNSEYNQNFMYSDNSDDQNGYLNKIQSIWKNIKKTKNMSAQKSSQNQSSSDQEDQTISYQKNKLYKNNQLKQQSDLGKCQQNIQILMKKLISAEQQIQYLEFQLDKQMNSKELLKKQLKKTKHKLQFQQKQNQKNQLNINHQNQQDFEFQQEKDKRTIQKLQFKIKALLKQIDNKDQEINTLVKDNHKLQILNSNKNPNIPEMNQNHRFKGSQILQLNQAYRTIQRLAALLKSTQQYKSIGNFAQQFKSIHFLNNIPKRLKQSNLNVKVNSKNKQNNNICNCMQIRINQKLLWTPMLCYKKMLQMKLKYDTLSQDCIQQVLFEINRLYTSKQQTRVSKLKSFYQSQILKLKKKTQLTYDQILAKKQIERLKKELTSKKKGIKINGQKKLSIMQDQSQIKQNGKFQKLRAIGQYEDQLKLKQRQLNYYRKELNFLNHKLQLTIKICICKVLYGQQINSYKNQIQIMKVQDSLKINLEEKQIQLNLLNNG